MHTWIKTQHNLWTKVIRLQPMSWHSPNAVLEYIMVHLIYHREIHIYSLDHNYYNCIISQCMGRLSGG